ncbi:MAG: phosphopantothenoylcysteine decarboxylase [Candidatus Omnitrophica bacterium]|nr:phosphopantothenoylcysteine decarboxylase [Candidatus Omnitrophota bacterium]
MKSRRRRLNILVTSGATREPIDAVRFISNYATGVLGCELAGAAKKRGHRVILICGLLDCPKPKGVPAIKVDTARQMQRALAAKFSWCDCLIMTAAIGDFRVQQPSKHKIKRSKTGELCLTLKQNPDILAGLGRRKGEKTLVGFALETEKLEQHAREKLRGKNLDLIVATQMKSSSYPFGPVKIDALIIDKAGQVRRIRQAGKGQLSRILLDSVEKIVLS